MRRQLLCLCFLITFASLAPAFADSFTIFSTGVDSSGTPLANNSQDTHWTLVTVTGPVSPYVITQANGFPDPPWNANDSASAWINPAPSAPNEGFGIFQYQTTFSLTGLDPTTASITGFYAADNELVEVLLNGTNVGISNTNPTNFIAFSGFTINNGFQNGTNTLDFVVNNDGGPTGLRVEIASATATASPVPEPSSLTLLGAGLLGGAGALRRKLAR